MVGVLVVVECVEAVAAAVAEEEVVVVVEDCMADSGIAGV